jgi:hypothetical protein
VAAIEMIITLHFDEVIAIRSPAGRSGQEAAGRAKEMVFSMSGRGIIA